jgi:carboxylesterase type B
MWPAQRPFGLVLLMVTLESSIVATESRDEWSTRAGHTQALENTLDQAPVVRLDSLGGLRGLKHSPSVAAFLGVPYASPPLRRWMPPGQPHGWEGVRLAMRSGPDCPASADGASSAPRQRQDEDCLYLDVFVPLTEAGGEMFSSPS